MRTDMSQSIDTALAPVSGNAAMSIQLFSCCSQNIIVMSRKLFLV